MGYNTFADNGADSASHVSERSENAILGNIDPSQKKDRGGTSTNCTGDTHSLAASSTSTERYQRLQHIPFAQFKFKVHDLCLSLWPMPDDQSTRPLLHDDTSGGSIGNGECQQGTSFSQAPLIGNRFVIEYLRGGTYNRIVGITRLDENTEGESRMILRVPRGKEHPLDHDICMLKFVQKYFKGPVPRILTCDLTFDNPLNAPYLLQTRLSGHDLQSKAQSYPSLTQAQKIAFVKEFARLFLNMQALEHPYAGQIDISTSASGAETFMVTPFEIPSESANLKAKRAAISPFFRPSNFNIEYAAPEKAEDELPDQTPYYLIMTQLGRWKHLELELQPRSIGNSMLDCLANAAVQLECMGYLRCESNCLTHYDLDPRNIMVEIQADGTLEITGILDWDLAMFAPNWVSYRPPIWIWDWKEEGEDERLVNDVPQTAEQRELKKLWEDLLGSDFQRYGCQPQYRLARRLFSFALYGLPTPAHVVEAEEFLQEWEELRQGILSGI